jgi:hypothetical protein
MGNARIIRPPLGLTCWSGQTSDVRTRRNASTFSQGTRLGKIGVRVSDLPGKIGRARKHEAEARAIAEQGSVLPLRTRLRPDAKSLWLRYTTRSSGSSLCVEQSAEFR